MSNRTALFSRKQPGGVFTIVDMEQHPGEVFFVDSGAANGGDTPGHGRDPDQPFLTLDYAIGRCTANQGDVIYVMPGHAETFLATNGFDADVAGIAIIGLGWGADRPTFTFNHANAQVNIGAASVRVENLRFVADITGVVSAVQVEGVTDAVFENCEWYWGGTTGDDMLISLELEAGSHRALIEGCRFLAEPAVAGAAAAINITGKSDNDVIRNNEFMGDYSTACVNGAAAADEGLMFLDNLVHNTDAGEPYLEVHAGTTGVIANTRGLASAATIAANAVAAAMVHCENFVANTTGTIAIIKGAGGSPALDAD
jgi:hypothetical protein